MVDKDKVQDIAEMIAHAASDIKARNIVILDMQNISMVVDRFIICSANSTKQVAAIADNIEEKLNEAGLRLLHKEGYQDARWILLDYGSCVAHVFVEEDRAFYNLEQLWSDAQVYQYKG